MDEANDQGRLPEPPEIAGEWAKLMERQFGTPDWSKADQNQTKKLQ